MADICPGGCRLDRSASLDRIFTHTARPAPMLLLFPPNRGSKGASPPRQPLPEITVPQSATSWPS